MHVSPAAAWEVVGIRYSDKMVAHYQLRNTATGDHVWVKEGALADSNIWRLLLPAKRIIRTRGTM